MGREIKRVPIGFDWPVRKKWVGFVNPLHVAIKCVACDGDGYSKEARRFKDEWYGYIHFDPAITGSKPFGSHHPAVVEFARGNILWDYDASVMRTERPGDTRRIAQEATRLASMWDGQWSHHLAQVDVDELLKAGRLMDLTHTWDRERRWQPKNPPVHPTAEQVNLWSIQRGLGHDCINLGICIKARCEREGVSYLCSECDGEGEKWPSQKAKELYEAWERCEPPTGDGWQLWETVSEGSPITPVFATAEALAEWCVANQFEDGNELRRIGGKRWNSLAGGTGSLDKEQWMKFIGVGWAPSAVSDGKGFRSGVEAIE